ncbi:MAG: SsrA-binding protein [Chloroflexi bacterium]|jgi:SsrA-binding protein|nr:SsrA-binding protein [Chloroflexota bacterium]
MPAATSASNEKNIKAEAGDTNSTKIKDVASNRKAYHDYFIEEKIEAGVVLSGTEIKSVRDGRVNLRDSYVRIENGEAWLWNAHISSYDHAGKYFNHVPTRSRKLLLHKNEIRKLQMQTKAKGLTLVPLRMYLKRGKAKIEVGTAQGKKNYDKRNALAERDANREMDRAVKAVNYRD